VAKIKNSEQPELSYIAVWMQNGIATDAVGEGD